MIQVCEISVRLIENVVVSVTPRIAGAASIHPYGKDDTPYGTAPRVPRGHPYE